MLYPKPLNTRREKGEEEIKEWRKGGDEGKGYRRWMVRKMR
jgi:hypothetical protein